MRLKKSNGKKTKETASYLAFGEQWGVCVSVARKKKTPPSRVGGEGGSCHLAAPCNQSEVRREGRLRSRENVGVERGYRQ
jgi:hypothetical protein